VTTSRPGDPDAIVQYLGSVSWIAGLAEEQRAETLARLAKLISDGETPAELPLHVVIALSIAPGGSGRQGGASPGSDRR
jgi:hypothetical protein